MTKSINISKTYFVDGTTEDAYTRMNAITSSPYNGSTFSIYGNMDSVELLVFIIMMKRTFFSTLPADIFSTKLSVNITGTNNKTRIDIKTITNPTTYIFLFMAFMEAVWIAVQKDGSVLLAIGIFLLASLLILGIDRLNKNMLIAGFEEGFAVYK